MPQPTRSGGKVLADALVANKVGHIFCVPGESYLPVLDALYDYRRQVEVIVCRQEGGAAYMAEAYGKLRGCPGVCFVSRGPGASNAMIGVHTAFQDSTPLLLFIGQIPRAERGREAFQELDYTRIYPGVAKQVLRIDRAADIPPRLFEAWMTAISDRPGPVVVELPEDMLNDQVAVEDCAAPTRPAARPPNAEAIARFDDLLRQSQRPVIICGGAAWTAETNRALAEFSEKHAVPVACAFRRQDMFDNTHPYYIGELGIAPHPELLGLVQQSDLVIALAARLGEMTTTGYTLFEVPAFDTSGARKLVHVFPSAAELNSVFRADLGLDCDAETFLRAVQSLGGPDHSTRPAAARRARIERARNAYLGVMQQPGNRGAKLRLDRIMAFLRARLPADSIIASGAGNYTIWAQRNYQFSRPNTQLACTNGSMGYGVPAAIAGKLARPQSTVVSFSGDGCFLMNGQELATAVRYRLNIIFLVINNRCYGTIRSHQQRRFPGRPMATSLVNPDFAALARAYGAFGARVARTDEFAHTFEQALNAGRPALIELPVDDSESGQ
ncbi:MAG: thiamine pyrophosphate-binding protein [Gammaproteobacteria bacterium]|nr:thiamine pyrophosphate-binding protein [Gammaproteobacteria bacterium]